MQNKGGKQNTMTINTGALFLTFLFYGFLGLAFLAGYLLGIKKQTIKQKINEVKKELKQGEQ